MIGEDEVRVRAEFMGLAHRQLALLRERTDLDGAGCLALLDGSSLQLGQIEWVRETLAEALATARHREALGRLAMYYEGYFEALARVLEVRPETLFATFDRAKVERLEEEMRRRPPGR